MFEDMKRIDFCEFINHSGKIALDCAAYGDRYQVPTSSGNIIIMPETDFAMLYAALKICEDHPEWIPTDFR